MQNFRLKYKPFPNELHGQLYGMTGLYKGKLTVIIDSLNSPERQKNTLKHELAHIALGHFEQTEQREMEALETEAIAKAATMTDADLEALLAWAI